MRTLAFYTLLILAITAGAILGISPILLMAGFSLALIIRGFLRSLWWEENCLNFAPLFVGGILGSAGMCYMVFAFSLAPQPAPEITVVQGIVALLTMIISAPATLLGLAAALGD